MLFIGVDPGANGGLAALTEDGGVFALTKMPDTNEGLITWFRMFEYLPSFALLEQVSGYIGVEHPGSSMFEFGRGYGALEMGLVASGFREETPNYMGNRYSYTLPQRWQRGLDLRTKKKGEGDTEWKNYLKGEASKRYLRIKVTKATADALLIAVYCKFLYEGKVE